MKIAMFIGREHHALKMMSLASELEQLGVQIETVISDNAINIDPATEFVSKYGITNVIHLRGLLNEHDVSHEEVNGHLDAILNSPLGERIPAFWSAFSVREALENLAAARRYADNEELDGLLILHGQNFWTKILAYCFYEKGKYVWSLEEGIILENEEADMGRYTGADEYIDYIFSWSKSNEAFYSGSADFVEVGATHLAPYFRAMEDDEGFLESNRTGVLDSLGLSPKKRTLMFAPPRSDLYRGDLTQDLKSLCSWSLHNGFNLIVRPHPYNIGGKEFKVMNNYPNVKAWTNINPIHAVLACEAVVSQVSTIAIEAAVLGIPIIEINTSNIEIPQSLTNIRCSVKLSDVKELEKLLRDLPEIKLDFKELFMPMSDGQSDIVAARHIYEAISYVHNSA